MLGFSFWDPPNFFNFLYINFEAKAGDFQALGPIFERPPNPEVGIHRPVLWMVGPDIYNNWYVERHKSARKYLFKHMVEIAPTTFRQDTHPGLRLEFKRPPPLYRRCPKVMTNIGQGPNHAVMQWSSSIIKPWVVGGQQMQTNWFAFVLIVFSGLN